MSAVEVVKQKLDTHKATMLSAIKTLDAQPGVSTQDYMAVKGTLATALMSADAIKDLLDEELSVEEITAATEQVTLIEETASACQSWGLV